MIFAKESIKNGIWEAYSDRKFKTKEAAIGLYQRRS